MGGRIDFHHHPALASHTAAMVAGGIKPLGARIGWTPEQSLEDMERGGVATAMLSLPQPSGIWPKRDVEQGRCLAREWNEQLTGIAERHPGRFGVFAALPVRDIEGCLREAEHALDELQAQGISLMTNFADKWLGDRYYDPLLEELDRRAAVVHVHPVVPGCCWNIVPELDSTVLEYAFDTTRVIAKLVFSGAAARFPRIRFVFSHAGGTMPYLIERLTRVHISTGRDVTPQVPQGVVHELQKFHYDTAQASNPYALGVLAKLVSASQIVFGTDFPFRTAEEHVRALRTCGFGEAELEAIERGNALRLLRLRAARPAAVPG